MFYSSIKKIIPGLFVFLLASGSLFLNSRSFVDSEIMPQKLWFYGVVSLIGLAVSIQQLKQKQSILFSKIDALLGVFYLYIFIHSFILGNLNKDTLLFLLCILLLYLVFKSIDLRRQFSVICLVIISLSTIEALFGIGQYFGFFRNPMVFKVVGSFDNPTGFAASLSIIIPMCFYLFEDRRKLFRLFSILSFVILLIAIVLSASRSGIVVLIVLSLFYIYRVFNFRISSSAKLIRFLLSLIIIIGIITFSLYKLKKDSADGRMLIWTVSSGMIKEEPFLGQGINMFVVNYMPHQAKYFQENNNSVFEFLADNINHPFNEYLLLVIERGFIGLLLLIIIVISLFKILRKEKSFLSIVPLWGLLALAVFSLFSYPMKYSFVWIILCLNLALLIQNVNSKWKINYSICFFTGFLAIFTLVIASLLGLWEYQWNWIATKSLRGRTQEMIPEYKNLYQKMKDNGLFLYNYAAELNYIKEYEKSLEIIDECEKRFNDYDVQMLKAENYLSLKKYDEAEKYFIYASEMCPVRFIPLNKLFIIYHFTDQKDKMLEMAKTIVVKPVKVPSSKINHIKEDAKDVLINY